METKFEQDFIRGIRIGAWILTALAVGWASVSFAATAWWALPNAWTTLSSAAWNDIVSQLNALAGTMTVSSGDVGIGTSPWIPWWAPGAGHRLFEISGQASDTYLSNAFFMLTNNRPTPATWDQIWAILFSSKNDQGGIHSAIASYLRGTGGANGFGSDLWFYTKPNNASPHVLRMYVNEAWNVGIGTATPQSTFQIVGNYVQIPNVSWAAPLASDCDQASEAGRMVIYTANTGTPSNSQLYICPQGGGWVAK